MSLSNNCHSWQGCPNGDNRNQLGIQKDLLRRCFSLDPYDLIPGNLNQGLSAQKLEYRDGHVSEDLESDCRQGREEKQHRSESLKLPNNEFRENQSQIVGIRSLFGISEYKGNFVAKDTNIFPKIQSNWEAHHIPDGSNGKGKNTIDDENLFNTSSSIVFLEHHTNTNDESTSPFIESSEHLNNANDEAADNKNDINESHDSCCITNSTVKDTVGWILVVSNLIFEILAAIFDQLSSRKHTSFALLSMMTSFAAFGICIIEVVCQCHQGKVKWRKRGKTYWWFYPSNKCFGNFKVTVGLGCALCQWIFGIISYIYYCQHHDNPIKLSIFSVVFASGLCVSKFCKDQEDKVEGDQMTEIVLP